MEDAVIVSALRTPVGSFGGQFKDVAATELGAQAVRVALERAEIAGEEVDEVVLGCVLMRGVPQPTVANAGRHELRRAGIRPALRIEQAEPGRIQARLGSWR